MDFDVLIVGLGPVGAVAANLAAKWGLGALAVDKADAVYDKPRAFGLDHEVMRTFANIGIAEAIAGHVMPYRTSEYQASGGRVLKRIAPASAPYPLGWAPNYVFSQPAIEGALRANLEGVQGVRTELGTEVLSVEQDGEACRALLRDRDGRERQVRTRYVLACDGGTSPLRVQRGLPMEDLQFDEPWLVVDVMVTPETAARLPATNIQFCETARPCTYIVGPGLHRRWEFMINDDETPAGVQQPEAIAALLARWMAPGEYELWRASAYRFHALILQSWRDRNLFFLGDAAHMTPPFMAQGMCQGIRDAANLVWKLALVRRGAATANLLDTYQAERVPHVRQTTLVTRELGRVICERDPARAAERDARMLDEMARQTAPTVRQSLIPGLSAGLLAPLLDEHPDSARGQLFPQPEVENSAGRQGLLDEFTGNTFRLVAAPGASVLPLREEIRSWDSLESLPLSLVALTDEADSKPQAWHAYRERDGLLAGWLRGHGCEYVLVRPDHYVYGGGANLAQALALLASLRLTLNGVRSEAPVF